MPESDNEFGAKKLSRQDSMLAVYNTVSALVAELCDVGQKDISSKSKTLPLPTCRGFCWYAIRITFDATYTELSAMMNSLGCHFTSAGIGASVGQAITQSIRSPHWSWVWDKVKEILPNDAVNNDKDKSIVIQIIIPKGSKDNIKFEIKEQNK